MINETVRKIDTEQIEKLLNNGSLENSTEIIDGFFIETGFRELKSLLLRLYISTDIYITAKTFAEKIGVSEEEFIARFGTVDDIEKLATPDASVKYFTEMLLQCIKWRNERGTKTSTDFSDRIKKYIGQNFQREDLSLKDAADFMNFTPTYFSSLFKNEIGSNFITYLTEIRIEKAKTLLCCTTKKIYEIAYEVGFGDYRYFSQIFKKHTGCTPQQYKLKNNNTIC